MNSSSTVETQSTGPLVRHSSSHTDLLDAISCPDSWTGALNRMSTMALANMLGRLSTVGIIVTHNLIIPSYGSRAVAAGALVSTWGYAVVGASRIATQTSVNQLLSGILGDSNRTDDKEKINDALWHARLFWGGLMSIPQILILTSFPFMLTAFGIDADTVNFVADYFYYFVIGIPAIMLFNCELCFFMSHEQTYKNPRWTALNAVVQISAALLLCCWQRLGFLGLGLSASIGYCVTLCVINLYFICYSPDLRLCQLPRWSRVKENFSLLGAVGSSAGIQVLSEWGNLLAISLLMAKRGTNALIALQVCFAWMSYFNMLLEGISSTASLLIKKRKSEATRYMNLGMYENYHFENKMIKRFAACNVFLCLSASLMPVVVLLCARDKFIDAFTHSSLDDTTRQLIKDMLLTVTIGQMVDAPRVSLASSLRGIGDFWFAPVSNFLLMNAVGLYLGMLLEAQPGYDENAMFIVRTGMVFLSCALNAYYFYRKSGPEPIILGAWCNIFSGGDQSGEYEVLTNRLLPGNNA